MIVKEQPGRPRVRPLLELRHEPAAVAGHGRRHGAASDGTATIPPGAWTHLAATYDGTTQRLYVNGTQVSYARDRGLDPHLDLAAEDRRQRDLGRVVQRLDRRGARLQPRAQRHRDPGRHERSDQLAGRDAAERAGNADGDRRARAGQPELGRRDRQRRRRQIQRPPLDDAGLHAVAPLTGSLSRRGRATPTPGWQPAPTTTRSPPRTPPGNVGPASNEASAAATADTTPPTAPTDLPATRSARTGEPHMAAADRRRRNRPLQRPPVDDAPASRRRRRTGSRSRRGRATRTPASQPAPTTTGSPPRTARQRRRRLERGERHRADGAAARPRRRLRLR